jgi:hypothetical protein
MAKGRKLCALQKKGCIAPTEYKAKQLKGSGRSRLYWDEVQLRYECSACRDQQQADPQAVMYVAWRTSKNSFSFRVAHFWFGAGDATEAEIESMLTMVMAPMVQLGIPVNLITADGARENAFLRYNDHHPSNSYQLSRQVSAQCELLRNTVRAEAALRRPGRKRVAIPLVLDGHSLIGPCEQRHFKLVDKLVHGVLYMTEMVDNYENTNTHAQIEEEKRLLVRAYCGVKPLTAPVQEPPPPDMGPAQLHVVPDESRIIGRVYTEQDDSALEEKSFRHHVMRAVPGHAGTSSGQLSPSMLSSMFENEPDPRFLKSAVGTPGGRVPRSCASEFRRTPPSPNRAEMPSGKLVVLKPEDRRNFPFALAICMSPVHLVGDTYMIKIVKLVPILVPVEGDDIDCSYAWISDMDIRQQTTYECADPAQHRIAQSDMLTELRWVQGGAGVDQAIRLNSREYDTACRAVVICSLIDHAMTQNHAKLHADLDRQK